MRIFKVKKRSEKSRRYVITRIYGFFVFSEICTFVQCGVRRNNIRRIFCRRVLKFTCEKIVRQCDRKTLLYYGFPVDSCYSGKFLLLSVLFLAVSQAWDSLFSEETVRQCDSCSATQNLMKIKYAGAAWGYPENAVKPVSTPNLKYIL